MGTRQQRKHQQQSQEKPSQNSDLSIYSTEALEMIANIHNHKPRKALNWRTPAKVIPDTNR
ncbi:hypothetical protein HMPREF1257_02067 [Corynebacterium sp. KPL1814]|nr:hypothetical protein HMPREF1281_02212 [Corynebacterium sp. KPL1855]ERS60583.1 hypothetical protein HMPREF1257_02067 [Corynebacterium sp. KPL1814]ERS78776.1 hypothetical protein HMPREF1285_01625 [Corynebacterium sp. KPL1859]